MPKVKLPDIPHAALTDHQIIAREGEPYPTAVFRQSALQLHGLIYLDGPPTGKPSIPPIVLLQAYGELRKTYLTYESFYKALLSRLANTDSENILVQRDLALEALQNGTPKHKICAIRHLSQAIKLGSTAPADYALLAGLLARAGNIHSVIILLRRGISLDPYYPQFYVSLALIYKHIREYSAAIDCLNRELSLFPEDSLSRRLLSRMAGVQRPFSQPCAH